MPLYRQQQKSLLLETMYTFFLMGYIKFYNENHSEQQWFLQLKVLYMSPLKNNLFVLILK